MDAIDDRRDGCALVRRAFDRFEAEVAPRWPALRAQVVHGDLTLDNALLDDENRITGIVDFGDMSHTALVADPISALDSSLASRTGDDLFRAAASLLDGYDVGHAASSPRSGR